MTKHETATRRRGPGRAVTIIAAALAAVAITAAAAQNDEGAEVLGPVLSTLIMPLDVYESGEPMRGELSLTNTSKDWVSIADASGLTNALSLVTESGKKIAPKNASLFGAAKTKELGPGGFVGFAFDAAILFPQLSKPGQYTLHFSPEGAEPRRAAIRVLPKFDADRDYWLELEMASGTLSVDLDERTTPAAVRHIVRLVRLGHYDNAAVARLQPGFAFKVSPANGGVRLPVPFEPSSAPLLAGSVILEPIVAQGRPVNSSNMVVLLGPQVGEEGRATVLGQVVGGQNVLGKLSESATTGATGSPAWIPQPPIAISRVSVIEKRR